jgi:hypothetical protein
MIKYLIFIPIIIIIAFIFTKFTLEKPIEEEFICGDKTLSNTCSTNKPYFCENKTLIKKASLCGCSDILKRVGDTCISDYHHNLKIVSLNYFLRGKEETIYFNTYEGIADYLSEIPQNIYHKEDEKPTRSDFKIKKINEEYQREFILPLVIEIQNIAKDKEDQARIAISLVQSIPHGQSQKRTKLENQIINYQRYPYNVLYDTQGLCGEKAELLALLLKELGYGVVLFYYNEEKHEAIGIKCPIEYSVKNTGYCFIETTGRSIITNDKDRYFQVSELNSQPEMIFISDGDSLGEIYEYKDAEEFIRISNLIYENNGIIMRNDQIKINYLRQKYGVSH